MSVSSHLRPVAFPLSSLPLTLQSLHVLPVDVRPVALELTLVSSATQKILAVQAGCCPQVAVALRCIKVIKRHFSTFRCTCLNNRCTCSRGVCIMSDNVLAGWSVLMEWPQLRLGHSVRTDRQLVHYPIHNLLLVTVTECATRRRYVYSANSTSADPWRYVAISIECVACNCGDLFNNCGISKKPEKHA